MHGRQTAFYWDPCGVREFASPLKWYIRAEQRRPLSRQQWCLLNTVRWQCWVDTFSNLPASATVSQVYEICSTTFFVTFSMQAALRLKDLCNVRQWPSRRERLILTTATRGRHSNVMLFADLINVYACDNSDNSIRMSAFHALHVYVIYANTFSCSAFSCPAISCPATSSVCFTSCNFTSSIFSAPVLVACVWFSFSTAAAVSERSSLLCGPATI